MKLFFATILLFSVMGHSQGSPEPIRAQARICQTLLLQNIDRPDTYPGVVVAATSKVNPEYYYFWIRDAALTMDVVHKLYTLTLSPTERAYYKKILLEYVDLSRKNQLTPNKSGGLGEPKFNVDATAFNGEWGRPQNDGPAIRASTLMSLASTLLKEGQGEYVRTKLYTVIKADLEFVSHHWNELSVDLWEEVYGFHFYTLMVQRRALVEGVAMARAMNDQGAAQFYLSQIAPISQAIMKFWDPKRGYLVATLNSPFMRGKNSNLDTAVILGVLHGHTNDGFMSYNDPKVLATAEKLRQAFEKLYGVNGDKTLGTAIGRYPEDTYNGYVTNSEGNPWFLTTLAFAELYSKTRFLSNADLYFARALFHKAANGSLSEQFNRYNGYMQGAPNLTWSYAAFITAALARQGMR